MDQTYNPVTLGQADFELWLISRALGAKGSLNCGKIGDARRAMVEIANVAKERLGTKDGKENGANQNR